ncbi:MAG: serine/threonine protein kinase [Proteobacteria bacterium]|nr:serine/threonine protein kinase [Pseudomonadota bacterium]
MVEPGGQLGAYRLLRQIGSGGMGRVWLAERGDGEYRQRVAIKLLKRGMDSDEILARFRVERQILADLSHPNIARLLDGGITPDGLPYLVMEYVEGLPLDEYCRALPDLRARLSLFLGVCEAVHYAHQRLLIHRDIKPGNVLVTADGTPKLLDFGIAKLLDPAAVDRTQAMTGHAMLLLTPRYASPEQIRGEATATTTDVYALGCLLFELLTGRHPFHESLGDQARLLREICLREPPRPSLCATMQEIPARQLAGDLDNIVLMALRKEPARRYGSAEQLCADVERHLRSEPVAARPNTLAYRTGRLLKRNPARRRGHRRGDRGPCRGRRHVAVAGARGEPAAPARGAATGRCPAARPRDDLRRGRGAGEGHHAGARGAGGARAALP